MARVSRFGVPLTMAAVVGCALALTLIPMVRLALAAIAPGGDIDLGLFVTRLSRPIILRATINTLNTAFFGALAALALGIPLTVCAVVTDVLGRRLLGFCLVLPLMIAPQITAIAWLHLLGPSSTLLHMMQLAPAPGSVNPMLGGVGISLLYGVQHAPIVYVTLRAGLLQVPRDLVEAARASGAGPMRILITIVLPIVRPYMATALVLAFVSGVGNFGIPALLGLPVNYLTLTTLIYQRLSSSGPSVLAEVAAISLVVAATAIVGLALQAVMTAGRRYRIEPGPPIGFQLQIWRWSVSLLAWGTVTVVLVLPGLALVTTSLIPTFGVPLTLSTLTLDNYTEVLVRQAAPVRAFGNSIVLSGLAAVVLSILAIPLAWSLARLPARFAQSVRTIIDLPYAIPGIVLAIAVILLFLRPLPIIGSLYATASLIFVAYLMRFLTLAAKPVRTMIDLIPSALDEAAAASGAGPLRRLVSIIAPLAAPAAVSGGLLIFMSALNELTVSALLWSSRHETIGVILFSLEDAGLGTQAAAIAVVSIGVVIVLLALVARIGHRLPRGVLPWR